MTGWSRSGDASNCRTWTSKKTQITDAGLAHLGGCHQLQDLNLAGTQITDAGLVHLEGLTHLELLDLSETKVTDAGLNRLEGLPRLRSVDLSFTDVTGEGVRRLQQALPQCSINTVGCTLESPKGAGKAD